MAPRKQLKIWFEAVREGGQIFFYASVDELELCDLGQITAYYEYRKRKSSYLSMIAKSENITKLARKVPVPKFYKTVQFCGRLFT